MHNRSISTLIILSQIHFPRNPFTTLNQLSLFRQMINPWINNMIPRQPKPFFLFKPRASHSLIHPIHSKPTRLGRKNPIRCNTEDFAFPYERGVIALETESVVIEDFLAYCHSFGLENHWGSVFEVVRRIGIAPL